MLELHGVSRTALRHRTQRSGVTKHLRQRHFGFDRFATANHIVHALNHAALGRQVAHHITGVVFRCFHLNGHHGFQDNGRGFACSFFKAEDSRHLERLLRRIHIVVRTEGQTHFDIDYRVASQNARVEGFFDAFLYRRNVFTRNHTAFDFVHELKAFARLLRLQGEDHMAVLTFTTRLTHKFAVYIGNRFAYGFAVRNLGLAHIGFHIELALHAVHDDFQVQLAHTGDDGLTRFFFGANTERRIFSGQTRQRQAHFFLVSLRFRLYGLGNHGLRKYHFFQHDRRSNVAQGFARGHIFQAHASGDIARTALFNFFALIGTHLHNTANAFFFAFGGVQYRVTFAQDA